ncbi:MAG: FAD-binding oxidoreductase [Hamadaea sp.]|uniref:NAD(P)/FAD-dependent oxidoreductase n=1 Tax=Hamadaea sp. TaxID=2024425 RepID=UPI00183FB3D0|nr:FAD-dependent oxidoreductase [Hamadaea sp.]NUR74301.1 FAD-binding oxidoreductase [Hamadaea sp.]NUT24199.1 FAD-binding oxidoreductase [Hamadaea sp.]
MRVTVIGAGIVGAACAYACAQRGLRVTVVDRGGLVAGTTGSGEGNILVSDKEPGPELDLALRSNTLWREWEAELDRHFAGGVQLERKGGLIVTRTSRGMRALAETAGELLDEAAVRKLEPHLAADILGGAFFPQDMQVQPARAAVAMLAAARSLGARVRLHTEVRDLPADADAVINATGAWAGQFGIALPVEPRRGFILVTEPLPVLIRHKVYSAEYLENVASGDADLQTSTVVEGTPGGPVLIGATRERVGFDRTPNREALRKLAAGAAALFPFLADVRIMRSYHGFRPYCADHLPVIGPDPVNPRLWHAHGHEGAGIGLAPATGELIGDLLTGATPALDPAPFSPARFAVANGVIA